MGACKLRFHHMPDTQVPNQSLMAQLQSSAEGVTWIAGVLAPWQYQRIEGGWSAHQHVAHLLDAETRLYGPRVQRLLAEDRPRLAGYDADEFMTGRYVPEPGIVEVAGQFASARANTLSMLMGARPGQWANRGVRGNGQDCDLAWVAERALLHVLDHLVALIRLHGEFEPQQGSLTPHDSLRE
jgi:hypothetical protein